MNKITIKELCRMKKIGNLSVEWEILYSGQFEVLVKLTKDGAFEPVYTARGNIKSYVEVGSALKDIEKVQINPVVKFRNLFKE